MLCLFFFFSVYSNMENRKYRQLAGDFFFFLARWNSKLNVQCANEYNFLACDKDTGEEG